MQRNWCGGIRTKLIRLPFRCRPSDRISEITVLLSMPDAVELFGLGRNGRNLRYLAHAIWLGGRNRRNRLRITRRNCIAHLIVRPLRHTMDEHDTTQLAISAAVMLIWLVCVVICFLKWKIWTAIVGIVAPILSNIPIGGMYWHHIITEPFTYVALPAAAIRLAKPVSWWAKWFYWGSLGSDRQLVRPSPKLARAFARFPQQTLDFQKPEV